MPSKTTINIFYYIFPPEINRKLTEDEESLTKLNMDINELHKKMDQYLDVIKARAENYIHC